MKDTINLPEKEYFSRQEVAERWGCKTDLVDYYIKNEMLREAYLVGSGGGHELSDYRYYVCDKLSPCFKLYNSNKAIYTYSSEVFENANTKKPDLVFGTVECPKYIYLDGSSTFDFCEVGSGSDYPEYYTALGWFSDDRNNAYIPICKDDDYQEISPREIVISPNFAIFEATRIITKVERNRFEAEYDLFSEPKKLNQNGLTTKTKNAYLKTIRALSNALIDGLTGVPGKDANALLTALDLKGIEHPVTAKTLASYLQQADDM